MAVDAQADALLHERIADLLTLERQQAVLAGDIRQRHRLFNQLLGVIDLVQKRLQADCERAEKIGQRDLHQRHHEGATDHDQGRRNINEDHDVAAGRDCTDNDAKAAEQSDERSNIHE